MITLPRVVPTSTTKESALFLYRKQLQVSSLSFPWNKQSCSSPFKRRTEEPVLQSTTLNMKPIFTFLIDESQGI
jgi:hypothetical protein